MHGAVDLAMPALLRFSSVLSLGCLVVGAVAACDGVPARAPGSVTTTSAAVPDPAALPPPSHTVDLAGATDNGGRTSDALGRSQFSGMRPTEAGGQSPTGTPGSGLPLPIERRPAPSESERVQRQRPVTAGAPRGAATPEVIGRVAAAWCDREQACGRVGAGRATATGQACLDGVRPGLRDDLEAVGCPDGFDGPALSACLGALRRAACDEPLRHVDGVVDCSPGRICLAH